MRPMGLRATATGLVRRLADEVRPDNRRESTGYPPNELDRVDQLADPTAGDDPVLIAHQAMWSGPLPPPSLLVEYDKAVANGAERILSMAERQSSHRMEMEATEVASDHILAQRGQWIGMVVVLSVLALAAYMAFLGATAAAAVVAGIDVVGLAAVFVYGSIRKRATTEIQVEDADLTSE